MDEQSPIKQSAPLSHIERERRHWINGTMDWSGPRCITGWRREYVISQQFGICAADNCHLLGQRMPLHTNGDVICEVDHIDPWHISHDSSRPNLQALCGTCHARKTRIDGSGWWEQE